MAYFISCFVPWRPTQISFMKKTGESWQWAAFCTEQHVLGRRLITIVMATAENLNFDALSIIVCGQRRRKRAHKEKQQAECAATMLRSNLTSRSDNTKSDFLVSGLPNQYLDEFIELISSKIFKFVQFFSLSLAARFTFEYFSRLSICLRLQPPIVRWRHPRYVDHPMIAGNSFLSCCCCWCCYSMSLQGSERHLYLTVLEISEAK